MKTYDVIKDNKKGSEKYGRKEKNHGRDIRNDKGLTERRPSEIEGRDYRDPVSPKREIGPRGSRIGRRKEYGNGDEVICHVGAEDYQD